MRQRLTPALRSHCSWARPICAGGSSGPWADGPPLSAVRRPGRLNRRGLRWARGRGRRALATDNYLLVLLLIVLSILAAAVADGRSFPLPTPVLFGGTLLYA